MSGRGVLFALDSADELQLLAIAEPRARAAFVANSVEERWDEAWLHAMDELWEPVHFCLHGSAGAPLDGAPAEAKAVLGGKPIGLPGTYSMDYKDSELVRRIGTALSRMRDDAVWARAGLVERKDYTGPRSSALQHAVVEQVHELAEFYRRAAEAGRCIVFTVDA